MPKFKVTVDEEIKYIMRITAKDKDEAMDVAQKYMSSPAHKSAFEVTKITAINADEVLNDS